MKKAHIMRGGWEGHDPVGISELLKDLLATENFTVDISETLDVLQDESYLEAIDLFVPVWTMGELDEKDTEIISRAVTNGLGIAGCHGGVCDAFRGNPLWQFITGGTWVAHPGGDTVEYTVKIVNSTSTLTQGIDDFSLTSEQYYLHVDPTVDVLAVTDFPNAPGEYTVNGAVQMPVCWTKGWGRGKIYYLSLGHTVEVFQKVEALEMLRRGLLWAARG